MHEFCESPSGLQRSEVAHCSSQVPPEKFMIFVCDCILNLMDKALAQLSIQEADKSRATAETDDDQSKPRFDKWTESPRSQDRSDI
jgi:hypothetical protein